MGQLDLAPFGFTPTESLAYQALLALGPSSGYAVARHLSLARANAYQALDGLVTKGGAALVQTGPRRYRAVRPEALLARIIETQTQELDRLERALLAQPKEAEEPIVRLEGARAVREIASRAIVRAEGSLACVAPGAELAGLAPALRARHAGGRPATVWSIGPAPDLPLTLEGTIPVDRATSHFAGQLPLLLEADGALIAVVEGGGPTAGYWSSDPLFRGLAALGIWGLTHG